MQSTNYEMQLHTAACDLLGCQYPVILAGMGGVSRSALVASVTNAGGYGFLGMVRESPELMREEINNVRKKTDKEFGVNIIPAATDPDLLEQQIAVCIQERVASVCLFWDVYPEIIQRLKDAGIIVVHQVGSLEDAEQAQAAGVHLLIAQGNEAGGHVRGILPLRELLSEILQVSNVPVLASGGIVNGHDLAEMLIAGAHGVSVGTAFLATKESYAHDYHKQRIVDSREGETLLTTLFHINWPFGAFTRVLQNSATRTQPENKPDRHDEKIIIGKEDGRPVYLYSTDSPLQSTTGDLEAMALFAGCGACRVDTIESAASRLGSMVDEAQIEIAKYYGIQAITPQTNQLYSSPCFAAEINYAELGMANDEEIIVLLAELLIAERAGARVTFRTLLDCEMSEYRKLFRSIYLDETRWCRMLIDWMKRLGHEPSFEVGSFYYKAMNIKDIEARINYLNRGQAWVVKKLKSISGRVGIVPLQEDLQDMLTSHIANIALSKNKLDTA